MKRYIFLIWAWYCITIISFIEAQNKNGFVEINNDIVKTIITLESHLPNYSWSKEFKELFHDVSDESIIAPYDIVKTVIKECIASCAQLTNSESTAVTALLEQYQYNLDMGNAQANLDELEDHALRKTKKIYKLCVSCLNVNGRLFVNGQQITGSSQTALASAYGQLSVSSQPISFAASDEWTIIPFDGAGPSSGMNVTASSPATMTIQKSGAYQVNFSVYLLAEDSDEGPFFDETYTFGIQVNDTTTPITAIIANNPNQYPVICSKIMEFSAGDTVQFYMKASAIDPSPIFVNHTTLQNGNAHLIQI